jgi:hypothetical protein
MIDAVFVMVGLSPLVGGVTMLLVEAYNKGAGGDLAAYKTGPGDLK